ncbi:unnamed protein product [Psylliodes chrysocephalus]|uniref:Uncharacterized protein n=1 Tax=Psylliodes chrysocephalus TaxID=3402493 RepID=A0A9P0CY04_9CUCU|nr:unnamed protein product [Psylliodes chrysocephala]
MCANDYSRFLELFDHRLKSFENWKGVVSPIDLALAGFHYIDEEDVVKCFECNIEINKWKPGDVPILDHLKFSPNCSYAKMMESTKKINEEKCSFFRIILLSFFLLSAIDAYFYTFIVLLFIITIYKTLEKIIISGLMTFTLSTKIGLNNRSDVIETDDDLQRLV